MRQARRRAAEIGQVTIGSTASESGSMLRGILMRCEVTGIGGIRTAAGSILEDHRVGPVIGIIPLGTPAIAGPIGPVVGRVLF